MMKVKSYSNFQLIALVFLRVVTGWYFLYEGLAKILSPGWTSYGYLMDSQGVFSEFFKSLGQNQTLMPVVDALNVYGLILIGLLLILGLFEKIGYIGALLLLVMYYLSHPASLNVTYLLPPEGSYLWINKNIVMMFAILVLMAFPSARRIGIDRFIFRNKKA